MNERLLIVSASGSQFPLLREAVTSISVIYTTRGSSYTIVDIGANIFNTIGSLVYSAYIATNSTCELKRVNGLCRFYEIVLHVLQKIYVKQAKLSRILFLAL